MKKVFFLYFILLSHIAIAQNLEFYPSNYIKFLSQSNDTLYNAFTGGMANPMFSNIDFNNDGRQDLFIFEWREGKSLTFLSMKTKDSVKFAYAPQYENAFPKMIAWAFLKDFNKDGKPDIFTYKSGGGISVYKNTSTTANLSFELYISTLTAENATGIDRIGANEVEFPAFADVDKDGDLDMLIFSTSYTNFVYYYKNKQELYPGKDTLVYWLDNQCWGRFRELEDGVKTGLTNQYTHNDSAYLRYYDFLVKQKNGKHAGSAIMAFDPDGDGDIDLMISDPGKKHVFYLQNAKIKNGTTFWDKDSIESYTSNYPIYKTIDLKGMPLGASVDINGDGFNDLLVSPMDKESKRKDFIWLYSNTSKQPRQQFKHIKNNFLEENMLDFGLNSAPAIVYYNNDSLPDLLVATQGEISSEDQQHLLLFINKGTKQKAVFKLEQEDFMGLATKKTSLWTPTIGDADNDGKADLLLGDDTGAVVFYRNIGTNGQTQFSSTGIAINEKIGSQTSPIDAGTSSKPALADLNNDGKLDLLIGNSTKYISYYKNITTVAGSPLFEKITDTFVTINNEINLAPCLTDLDKDGKPELLVGTASGKIYLYSHISDTSKMLSPKTKIIYNFQKNEFQENKGNWFTTIAAASLDQDGKPDLLLGNLRGGLYFMGSKNNGQDLPLSIKPNIASATQKNAIHIYPNPTHGNITIKLEVADEENIQIILTDISGKQIWQTNFLAKGKTEQNVALPDLTNGLYFINATDLKGNKYQAQKLFMLK